MFEISDSRLSRYWIFSIYETDDDKIPFLSFPEWVNDPYFYGELIEDNSNDPNAIIFRRYKELMDLEFPNPSISETAQVGDSEWLICPKCQTIYNNPRYKNEWPHLPGDSIKFKIA